MRFDLTPASHRVLERAARLRLQRGMAAISSAKLLWALFEEDECRAAQWLHEAGLSLEQFGQAFGVLLLQSPITAPAFPAGSYGVSAGQYAPPPPPDRAIDPSRTGNNSPNVGNPFPEPFPPDESEQEHQDEPESPPQDAWEPSEEPKYSLYAPQQQGGKPGSQSRLRFYLDEQLVNIGLLTPELENNLETAALRFVRQERNPSIAVSGGTKQVALGALSLTLTTEHLFLAVVLDNGDVGRYLRDNGFDAAELYLRMETAMLTEPQSSDCESAQPTEVLPDDFYEPCRLSQTPQSKDCGSVNGLYRLLDAAANRGREAMRVLEDYVRFILDDADLTERLKNFRHQFQEILKQFPMELRLEARNTESDVGTDISAEGEYVRPTLDDLVSANFSRLQESLRSLEEFSKMFDPHVAKQFEQLRYACYTLHKDVSRFACETPSAHDENVPD